MCFLSQGPFFLSVIIEKSFHGESRGEEEGEEEGGRERGEKNLRRGKRENLFVFAFFFLRFKSVFFTKLYSKYKEKKKLYSNSSEALGDQRPQPRVLQSGRDPLLVCQLAIHVLFLGVRSPCDGHVDLEPPRKRLRQPDAQAEADERRHRAVRDRRGEFQRHRPGLVVNGDGFLGDDAQLLERVGVLRVGDGADVVEDLSGVDGLAGGVSVGEGGRGLFFFFLVRGGGG